MQKDFSRMTVIIPTLNEEGTIGALIKEIISAFPGINITVCDDDSSDNTINIVKSFARQNRNVNLMHRKNKQKGLTASIIDGIGSTKTEYFLVMDADFQHPPQKIGAFFDKLEQGCDFVLGNRIKIASGWPIHRRVFSFVASALGKARLAMKGFSGYDTLTGLSAGRAKAIRKIISGNRQRFAPKCYQFAFHILKFAPSSLKVGKVDYTFSKRETGASKLGAKQILEFLKLVLT